MSDPKITTIKCHTCAASPGDDDVVEKGRFTCAYCGTVNVIEAALNRMVEEHSDYFSGPVDNGHPHSAAILNLVHASQNIRSSSKVQLKGVQAKIDALDAKSKALDHERQKKIEKQNQEHSTEIDLFNLSVILFCVAILFPAFQAGSLGLAGGGAIIVGAIVLWFVLVRKMGGRKEDTKEFPDGCIFPLILGASALFYFTMPWGPLLGGGIALFLAVGTFYATSNYDKKIGEIEKEYREQRELLTNEARNVIEENWHEIARVQRFQDLRMRYEMVEEQIPYGIRMDQTLAMLNDMEFGKIADDVSQLGDATERLMKELEVGTLESLKPG